MKFRIESHDLIRVAGWTRAIAERGQADAILGFVLLEAAPGAVTFRSTDRRMEIECKIEAHVETTGKTTVSATVLNDLARRLPEGSQVTFEYDGEKKTIRINSNRTRATLPTCPNETFPRMASEDYQTTFSIDSANLGKLFERSRIAVCQDGSRDYLCGVFFHLATQDGDGGAHNVIRCVATDGFQLAMVDVEAPAGLEEMPAVIIPIKTVSEASKIFAHSGLPVEISVSENKIRFANQSASLSSRLLSGQFPDYTRLIPHDLPLVLKTNPREFRDSLLRVSVVADNSERAVTMDLEDDSLAMTIQDPATGRAKEELAVSFPHSSYQITFKHGHLLGMTDQMGDGPMVVRLQQLPGATQVSTESDPDVLYLLMPLRP